MEVTTRTRESNHSAAPAPCPVCGAPMLNVGNFCRCGRCIYSICESCEGGRDDELAALDHDES